MTPHPVQCTYKLGTPWVTQDPFLFCMYHNDHYPEGNDHFGPDASLENRTLGNDFVIRDGWRMYHGETVPGFPAHPHRGFETVTFVLKGLVDHADSKGAAGRYGNGDVQWMTAGNGLQHSEMFPLLSKNEKNPLELFQIWINLPAAKKFVPPYYKMLWKETIPKISFTNETGKTTLVDLIAGSIGNAEPPSPAPDSWAAAPENHVAVWHITMEPFALLEIPAVPALVNRSLYHFEGDIIKINDYTVKHNHVAELDSKIPTAILNGEKPSRLLFLQGKPINEPVVQYGPFVMNTREEIQQAFSDFQKTRFGGWPWKRTDMVHDREKGRFARFENGDEIVRE